MKFNLNFASNENWAGVKQAWRWCWRSKNWQTGEAKNNLALLLAEMFNVSQEQVFFTLAARSLLYHFLLSLELAADSEVLVQAFTCEAVVLPVIEAGLKPIYVDLEAESWSMNLADLKHKTTKKTRVLILQHTFGMLPRDRKAILAWAKKEKLIVIEDLAHGFAAELLESQEKTNKLLSFGRSKFFSSVHGGALLLNDQELAASLNKKISNLPLATNKTIKKALLYKILAPIIKASGVLGKILHASMLRLKVFAKEISAQERAGNYDRWLDRQLPNVFAALIIKQLNDYANEWQQRVTVAKFYQQQLGKNFILGALPCLRYPVLVAEPKKVLGGMRAAGYVLGDWYQQVVAPAGLDLAKVQYELGSCPLAESHSQRVINLPLNVSLKMASDIIANLKKVLNVS